MASSSDGTYLIAGVFDGHLLYSSDGGTSWSTSNAPTIAWYGVASRGDGRVAIAQVYSNGGLYISSDFGATWSLISSAPQLSWNGISSSADGSTWIASSNQPNAIYRSVDGGLHWSILSSAPSPGYWSGVSCNSDCSVIYASDGGGRIYKSTDSAASWFALPVSSLSWTSIFCSADGTRVATVAFGSGIYLSTDSGASFSATSAASNNWEFVTGTSDCGIVFAADQNGRVWKSFNLFPSFPPTQVPTQAPTAPTYAPSSIPTNIPTEQPSQVPSTHPTGSPTHAPSSSPSKPTFSPSRPTAIPTAQPTQHPSAAPTELPSTTPSHSPSRPTFIPTSTPSYSPSDCVRLGVNLSSLVLDSSGTRKCFVSASGKFIYSFTIPVCGSAPSACSGFGPEDLGQIGTTSGGSNYNLGTYTEPWRLTTYLGQNVLSVSYVDGTYCPGVGARSSELILLCNRARGTTSIMEYEANCSYVFVLQTSDTALCNMVQPLHSTSSSAPTVINATTSSLSTTCYCDRCSASPNVCG